MADYRTPSRELRDLAADLIQTDPKLAHIAASSVRIGYVTADVEKTRNGRAVLGQCEKVPDRYKWAMPFDFFITFYEPNCERLTDAQRRVLMLHELMHVGVDVDGNEESYRVVPHDVEDFRKIIEEYGMDWDG